MMPADRMAVVVLGAPHTPLDALGRRLAEADRGVYVGDLQISHAENVGALIEMFEMAQTPLHEPLHAFLRQHVSEAVNDPAAWLAQRRDWSFDALLHQLMARIAAPLVVFSDAAAGLRIHQAERWTQALPQAFFVHAVSGPKRFAEAARAAYEGSLFVPPDFRDYSIAHGAPQLQPLLAWVQVHRTLARVFNDNSALRSCLLPLERLENGRPLSLSTLSDLPRTSAAATQAPTLEALAQALGYV